MDNVGVTMITILRKLYLFPVEIENVMRSATVDIRANPRVVASCPRSIEYCTKRNSQTDDSGKVVMLGDKIEGTLFVCA